MAEREPGPRSGRAGSGGPGRSAGQGARAGAAERGAGGGGEEPPAPPGPESARPPGPRPGAEPAAGLGARRPEAQGMGADPKPADWRGSQFTAWLRGLTRMVPGLPGGEPAPAAPQCGACSEAGAASPAREIRSTAERLEAQLQALKGSSDPLTLEFLQALEAPVRIASRLLAENQRLRRELEELKGRVAAPPPREEASPPHPFASQHMTGPPLPPPAAPAPWESSLWATPSTALRLQVRVSGKTAGCERHFLDQLAQRLAGQGLSLQAEEDEPLSGRPLLLFCPIASRAGTDIGNALAGLPAGRQVVLVVLHHQLNERAELYAASARLLRHPGLLGAVDGCFSTRSGFYPCPANAAALAAVAALLQQLARASP